MSVYSVERYKTVALCWLKFIFAPSIFCCAGLLVPTKKFFAHDSEAAHAYLVSFVSAFILLLLPLTSTRIRCGAVAKRRAVRKHLKTLSGGKTFKLAMNPIQLNERGKEEYCANSKTCLGPFQVFLWLNSSLIHTVAYLRVLRSPWQERLKSRNVYNFKYLLTEN